MLIPLIILLLRAIHQHYGRFAEEVKFVGQSPIVPLHHTVVVPVNGITKPTAGALVYATTISADVRATYIELDSAATAKLRADWDEWDIGVELVDRSVALSFGAAAAGRLRGESAARRSG